MLEQAVKHKGQRVCWLHGSSWLGVIFCGNSVGHSVVVLVLAVARPLRLPPDDHF